MNGSRLRVALIFGGRSGEHEVSVVSARFVASLLSRDNYEVIPMAIDRAGLWATPDEAGRILAEDAGDPSHVGPFLGKYRVDPRLAAGAVDVAVPILHGPFGEDGTIQGLCEILDVPYVGCGVEASAVTMDKMLTKRVLRQAGVPTPDFVGLTKDQWADDPEGCTGAVCRLARPWFVKPSRMGSSVGISKVKSEVVLAGAIDHALIFDDLVVVEEAIPAREIEVAVLGTKPVMASIPGEVVPGHEFYDYADKYLDNACQLLAPAPLTDRQAVEARRMAVDVFQLFGCDGMARVDFLLDTRTGAFLVNELNTIPGFTSISMFPRLMELSGVKGEELIDTLVALGLSRHRESRRLASAALLSLGDRLDRSGEC